METQSNLSNKYLIINEAEKLNAPLPASYQKAITAITQCDRIDEVKNWSDKMQALSSYYKQANDTQMENMCKRIKARAQRRCYELISIFDGRNGQNLPNSKNDHEGNFSKRDIAQQAGITEKQQRNINNIGKIPEDEFNKLIESDNVPSTNQLSNIGKEYGKKITKEQQAARDWLAKPKPENFSKGVYFVGDLKRLVEKCKELTPDEMVKALEQISKKEAIEHLDYLESWLDRFVILIQSENFNK